MIASQLISGGPGPDYGIKHSKLEAGIRELTAVVLVPPLPADDADADVSSNWFKLNDPEHLGHPHEADARAGPARPGPAQGVRLGATPSAIGPSDLRVLQAKIHAARGVAADAVEGRHVAVREHRQRLRPLRRGGTAMAPELVGFEGLDLYKPGIQSDVFVFGKYFSIHETHVIVGGVPLPRDGFSIISREVLQVRLPDRAW